MERAMKMPAFTIEKFGVFDSNVAFPKMTRTDVRRVDCYELELYSADCDGETYLDGRAHPLKCGTVILSKPGQNRNSLLPFKCYYVHWKTEDPEFRKLLAELPDYMVFRELQPLIGLFHELLTVESAELPENYFLVVSIVFRMLRLICQQRKMISGEGSGGILVHQANLLLAEKYIQEHFSETVRLEELAALCGLSPNYFHKLFSAYFGKTPTQYLHNCRIAEAKKGLLVGDYSLCELAADCGFSSQAYFCSKFKEATGKTPMEYRREMLGRLLR